MRLIEHRSFPVLVPTVLSLALGIVAMGHVQPWRDEYATFQASSLTFSALIDALHHVDAVLGPYYVLMRSLTAFGLNGVGLRLPSVLAAAGTVALIALLARRWWGPAPALVSGITLAINPLFVQLSRDARPYALALFFASVALLLLDTVCRADRSHGMLRLWIGYVIALLAAGLLHPFALLMFPAHIVLVWGRSMRVRRSFTVAVAISSALLLPLFLQSQKQRAQVGWIPQPTVTRAVGTLANVVDYVRDGTVTPSSVVAVLVVLVAAASPFVVAWRRSHVAEGRPHIRLAVFAIALTVVPWAALLMLSLVAYPILTSHYLFAATAGVALLLGAATDALGLLAKGVHQPGVSSKSTRPARWRSRAERRETWPVAGVIIVLQLLIIGPTAVTTASRAVWQDDYPSTGSYLIQQLEPGDTFIVVQAFHESGFAFGLATATGDFALRDDVLSLMSAGALPAADVRTVVTTSPFSTRATEQASGRVLLVSVAGTRLSPAAQQRLTAVGCALPTISTPTRDFGTDRVRELTCAHS